MPPKKARRHNTRPAYSEWGIETSIDEENEEFVIKVPFASEELPYYPVLVAALIAARSSTTMYNAVTRNLYNVGEQAAEIEGTLHVHHDSLVAYLRARDASDAEILARKRATLERVAKSKIRPRRRPNAPVPVVATPSAQNMIDSGALDFLDSVVSRKAVDEDE